MDVLAVSPLAAHRQTAGRRLTVRRRETTAVTCVVRSSAATALTLVFEVGF